MEIHDDRTFTKTYQLADDLIYQTKRTPIIISVRLRLDFRNSRT
ncbi:hypothetical protein [Nostoc commune]|nr:hypothetical protein [Nostoc commune]